VQGVPNQWGAQAQAGMEEGRELIPGHNGSLGPLSPPDGVPNGGGGEVDAKGLAAMPVRNMAEDTQDVCGQGQGQGERQEACSTEVCLDFRVHAVCPQEGAMPVRNMAEDTHEVCAQGQTREEQGEWQGRQECACSQGT